MTLYPGTIITTGTPSGTAMEMEKPEFLKRWQTSLKSRWTRWANSWNNKRIVMSKRYSGKSQRSKFYEKAKLTLKERKLKREKRNK